MSGGSGGSGAWPVLWLSTHAVQIFLRLRRALFRSSFALQTFPFLFRSSFPLFSCSRQFLDGGVFRSIGNFLIFIICFFDHIFGQVFGGVY